MNLFILIPDTSQFIYAFIASHGAMLSNPSSVTSLETTLWWTNIAMDNHHF